MAYDMLTSAGINSFITDWTTSQMKKKVDPLTNKQKNWTDLETAYTSIGDKLTTLKANVYALQLTGTQSAFLARKATTSDSKFVDISATSQASLSSSSIRVNQLAKNDLVMSQDLTSTADSATFIAAGTHSFQVTAGDGKGGVLTSNIDVTFDTTDFTNGHISNEDAIAKIQTAISQNKAVVTSNSVTGSTASTGSFNLNLNGTTTVINYTAGTYSDVMDSIVSQINKINGVNAQKIVNGSNCQLQITVTDASKYLTIDGDTSGLLTELNVSANQLMGGAGLLTASTFKPTSDLSQLSLSAAKSGYDYRLLSMTDLNGGQALTSLGINIGATRPSFVQNASGPDTPGFVYTTDLLNAKFEFNGINVERNSNTISDLLSGATVTLNSLMQPTDTTVNLTVTSDVDGITNKIQDFIKNFDDLYVFLKQKTKTTVDNTAAQNTQDNTAQTTTSRGILIGDSTANSLLSLFTNVSCSSVAGINTNELNSLSRLGITFDTSTGLSVSDSSKLTDAIKSTPDQVEAIFNSVNGVAVKLYNSINPYINATGYIYKSKQNFDSTISYLNDRIQSTTDDINKQASDQRLRYLKQMSQINAMLNNSALFIMNGGAQSFWTGTNAGG